MIYKNILLIVAIIAAGCSSSDSVNTVKDTEIDFFFVNENGEDLLDPDHPNAITEQNTDLYYLSNGVKEKVYEENMDSPKMFFVSDEKQSGKYFMRVFPNIIPNQERATTYLEFEDSTIDTIEVEYEEGDNFTAVSKVWYNQELKWDVSGEESRNIEVIK